MAEHDLNIIVKVFGQAELNGLIDKIKNGTDNINDAERAAKLMTQTAKSWEGGNSAVRESVYKSSIALKDHAAIMRNEILPANGRMMQSYFQSGEALRIQTLFANGLSKGFQTLGMSTERATSISQGFGASLGMMVGVVGAVVGAVMGLEKAFEMAMIATRMELLRSTMQQMAQKDGVDFARVIQDVTDKIGGSVSHNKILQGISDLQLLGIEWKEMPRIMELVENRSKLIGKSFDETMQIVERASMGNKKAILALKIPVFDVKDAYDEYAKTIGTTGEMLNEVGQKHAVFQKILKEAEEQHLNINEAVKQELEKYENLETAWANLGEKAGKFATALTPVVKQFAAILESINNILAGNWEPLWNNLKRNLGYVVELPKTPKVPKAPRLVGEVVESPLWEGEKNPNIDYDKLAKKKAEDEKKRLELIQKRIAAELKHDKEQQDADNWHESALSKEASYVQEAIKSGDLTKQQAIEELQILETMAFTEEERVKIRADIANIEKEIISDTEKEEREKQKLLKTAQELLKEEQDRILATGTFYERMKLWSKEYKKELDTNKIAAVGLQDAIGGIGSRWSSSLYELIQGTQNIGQAFKSMGQAVIQEIEVIIAKLIAMKAIELLLSLIPGGGAIASAGEGFIYGAPGTGLTGVVPHATGGWLNEPVLGVGLSSGRLHTFAEKQPEYISTVNQISQASKYGSNQMQITTKQMETRVKGADVYIVHQIEVQSRKNRVG